jgi:hypothetical protein
LSGDGLIFVLVVSCVPVRSRNERRQTGDGCFFGCCFLSSLHVSCDDGTRCVVDVANIRSTNYPTTQPVTLLSSCLVFCWGICGPTMAKTCKFNGCRKYARGGVKFCLKHAPPISSVHEGAPSAAKAQATTSGPEKKEKTRAYYKRFSLSTDSNSIFASVRSIIDDMVVPGMTEYEAAFGGRSLVYLEGAALEAVTPLLVQIVAEARSSAAFPLTHYVIRNASLIVAPKVSSRSNSWTMGGVHRDMPEVDTPGVYSFMVFLDEVTLSNGAVQFWKESKLFPLNVRHAERPMRQTRSSMDVLVGPKGTVFAWDARLLHRSLPNNTGKWRRTVQFMVSSPNGPDITIVR